MKKWKLVLEVAVIVGILLVAKTVVHFFDRDTIAVSTLFTAFVGGVIFTLAIIFSGVLADYKESEKIPGELATSIKTLYKDTELIPSNNEEKIAAEMRSHIKELLRTLISNFRRNTWELREINSTMNHINNDIKHLPETGIAPVFIARYRTELSNIDKISNRVEVITRTSFLPSAFAISEIAIGLVLILMLFMKIEPYYVGLLLLGSVAFLLIGIILLINDMDNPFEYGKGTHADIDLSILLELEPYLDSN
jgi:hypothetical protein